MDRLQSLRSLDETEGNAPYLEVELRIDYALELTDLFLCSKVKKKLSRSRLRNIICKPNKRERVYIELEINAS